ncbi:2-dehydro-3-deoxygalactonokinase [Rhizobium sp. YJ-22]|uniref:2-dehydro-3-deoxygalactonokinase n=1 Tax=Rhizobium sp. YJ-22 TaxID=3037556 RepID=UPI002412669A|nr:2-dehydro-3-deoxygalactonokinase [Rhizobium sp. YJ-22]MDG3575048.1 2-dehydro-3-deoxygalactonokinase [Rhizobium sp. YJ-22]
MSNPAYIAVDWGTSSFRLWMLDRHGDVLAERRSGEGMTVAAASGFGAILDGHLAAIAAPAGLPVLVCGMAGARQGWVEAGYVDLPAPLDAILTGAVSVPGQTREVRILPGLAQRRTQAPDVMRGEETQLLGALTAFGEGAHRVCMPGTHSKWVEVDGDTVQGFSTYMTGELFDVVTRHSILSHAVVSDGFDDNRFGAAVLEAWEKPADISNLLFRARAGQLLHGLPADAARAQISGHLIGLEIAGALEQDDEGVVVRLVASGRLQTLYEAAFATLSIACTTIDADEAVRRGLHAAAVSIWPLTR